MKITAARVKKYALDRGWEPLQIDGIPEGFAWRVPDITIGTKTYKGEIIKFEPLADFETGISYEEAV